MAYSTDFNTLLLQLNNTKVNPQKLVSKQADNNATQLFEYLKSVYGKKVLAGQQYLQKEEIEDDVYYNAAKKLPAIRGYDLMDMDKNKHDNQIERAIRHAKETGCIITLCWHWYAPDDMNDLDNCVWSFYYKNTNYDRKTSFDLLKAVEPGTPEYDFAISRIDKAAEMLRRLENEGIPVLWRPLHEAFGNWFWWGNRGGEHEPDLQSIEAYKKLWYMIFDRLENYHKLTNLIWVWNGQNKLMEVNPNTYDIVGEDIYSQLPNDHSSQKAKFDELTDYTHGKLAALSECGYIPHPNALAADKVKWLWWLPWWGEFVYEREGYMPKLNENGLPMPNKKYMSAEFIKEVFENPYCVTLDKLPWYNEEKCKIFLKNRFGD